MALEPEWEHCAGDWAAFDFRERRSGLRIQVKQSAARQSWHKDRCPPARPRFSIAEKTAAGTRATGGWPSRAGMPTSSSSPRIC